MKKHILIVDDDAAIRSSLKKILDESGYEVTCFENGKAADAEFVRADLLILDLNLPIQDGWDILGQVNSEYPLLPVIVITGLADQLDEKTIPGASAFLEKPIEVPVLLRTIEGLLSRTPQDHLEQSSRFAELRHAEFWRSPFVRPQRPKRRSEVLNREIKRSRSR